MNATETIDTDFTTTAPGVINADRAAWLATRPQDVETAEDFKALTALYLTAGRGTGWGKDLTPTQARVLAVSAQTTGLNPLRGEIVMLGGNPYVTEAGIQRTADQHPQYDGYELVPMNDPDERKAWGIDEKEIAFKCLAYRKDRSRPFVGVGHAAPKNIAMKPIAENWLSEMAQKRAVERALSRAFPSGIPTYDEQAMALPNIVSATVSDVRDAVDEQIDALVQSLGWKRAQVELERKRFPSRAAFIEFLDTEATKPKTVRGKPVASKSGEAVVSSDEEPASSGSAEGAASAPAEVWDAGAAKKDAARRAAQNKLVSDEMDRIETTDSRAAEEAPTEEPVSPATLLMSKAQQGKLFATLQDLGIKGKPERHAWAEQHGVEVPCKPDGERSFSLLTEVLANKLIDIASRDLAALEATAPEPHWNTSGDDCVACGAAHGATHHRGCPEVA